VSATSECRRLGKEHLRLDEFPYLRQNFGQHRVFVHLKQLCDRPDDCCEAQGSVARANDCRQRGTDRRPQGQVPETDLGNTPAPKIIKPCAGELVELRTGRRASIADPHLGIQVCALSLAFNHPRVEASAQEPAAHSIKSVGFGVLPIAEDVRDAAASERRFESGNDRRNSTFVTPFTTALKRAKLKVVEAPPTPSTWFTPSS